MGISCSCSTRKKQNLKIVAPQKKPVKANKTKNSNEAKKAEKCDNKKKMEILAEDFLYPKRLQQAEFQAFTEDWSILKNKFVDQDFEIPSIRIEKTSQMGKLDKLHNNLRFKKDQFLNFQNMKQKTTNSSYKSKNSQNSKKNFQEKKNLW